MGVDIQLTKNIFGDLNIDRDCIVGIYSPKSIKDGDLTDEEICNRICNPVGTKPLAELVRGKQRILIVTDDNTRATPLARILPPVLSEIRDASIKSDNITILIGLGTHRAMSVNELLTKFGKEIVDKYKIVNHAWNDPEHLVSLGSCELGYDVIINRLINEVDFILSIGSIVPHATTGFSGGGKTIMPGICGEKTIENTHWAALKYDMAEILGNFENRIRNAIVSICRAVELGFIINTILCNGSSIYDIVAGDVEDAHRKGVAICESLYGVSVPEKADIVIAEAYPTDIDLRQAIKAICAADLVCKDRGVIILPAECPEGLAPQFPNFSKYGFSHPQKLFNEVESGKFKEKLLAYTLVAIGRIISNRVTSILVSPNIAPEVAQKMGFIWAPDLQDAWNKAKNITGSHVTIVLKKAGELLPIISSRP